MTSVANFAGSRRIAWFLRKTAEMTLNIFRDTHAAAFVCLLDCRAPLILNETFLGIVTLKRRLLDMLTVPAACAALFRPAFAASLSAVVFVLVGAAADRAENIPTYNRDVRPILSDRCFTCHGPDSAARRPTCGSTARTMPTRWQSSRARRRRAS